MAPTISVVFFVALLSSSLALVRVPIRRTPKTFAQYQSLARDHVKTLALSASKPTEHRPYSEQISQLSSDYCITIYIGTPPQEFSVLLKLPAQGLWVPSFLCPTEKYDICKNHRRFRGVDSVTYVTQGKTYSQDGMSGNISKDTVSIAGQDVMQQPFAEVMAYSYNDSNIPYDGILGLSANQTVFRDQWSIFENMAMQGIIENVTYALNFVNKAGHAGEIFIGGGNPVYDGELEYASSLSNSTWEVTIVDVVLLFSEADSPRLCSDGCTAVLDSGTHFISANHKDMTLLHRGLGAIEFLDDFTFHFNCSDLESLQPVFFSIGESLFKIPKEHYVDRVVGPQGEEVCMSAFVGLDDIAGPKWYLGDAFFASMYVEFHADSMQIGFAQTN